MCLPGTLYSGAPAEECWGPVTVRCPAGCGAERGSRGLLRGLGAWGSVTISPVYLTPQLEFCPVRLGVVLPCPSDPADRAQGVVSVAFLCLSVGRLRGHRVVVRSSRRGGGGGGSALRPPGERTLRRLPLQHWYLDSAWRQPMHPSPRLAQDGDGSHQQDRPSRMAKGRREPVLSSPVTRGFGVRPKGVWGS